MKTERKKGKLSWTRQKEKENVKENGRVKEKRTK